MKIQTEVLTEAVFEELLPLARSCWHESTVYKGTSCAYDGERDFPIEPDLAQYLRFQSHGWLVLVTLRNEQLCGYGIGLLYESMHHKGILGALGDTFYVQPDYRSYSPVLAEALEKALAGKGAHIIGWPVHINGPVYQLLEARGYTGDDVVMEKRLK